jgi:hypothetical protein
MYNGFNGHIMLFGAQVVLLAWSVELTKKQFLESAEV